MFERTVSPEDLARLKDARETADVAYNRALSALDAAVQHLRELPPAPVGYDEHQITPLNERWDLVSLRPPLAGGWRGRLQTLVWSLVAPLFDRQHAFNAALVDHLNRNVAGHRDRTAALLATLEAVREALAGLTAFELRVIEYAQQITPYVDTKDREIAGLMRRINEDVAEVTLGLASTVTGIGDELRKRWETTLGRERRLEARLDELQATMAVAHQAAQTLKREMARFETGGAVRPPSGPSPAAPSRPAAAAVDSYKYVGFEDAFRGSPDEIRSRLTGYLPYFEGAADVLDVGCGRGEFLELLRDRGVSGRGIDVNHEMVEQCRARGLEVEEADLRGYLTALDDGALGGLFAAQVVEHLEPAYLIESLDLAFHRLRPGSTLILETINVASWSAFFQSYLRDVTHVRPLHPDTLRYLVTASGFQGVEIVFRSPCAPQDRLETVGQEPGGPPGESAEVSRLVAAFNENVEKLNQLLFADQDYAVVARRL